jgi:uncharacterized protein (DUF58 family)
MCLPLADAILSLSRLDDVSLECQPVVRFTKGQPGVLTVMLNVVRAGETPAQTRGRDARDTPARRFRLAIAAVAGLGCGQNDLEVTLPAGAARVAVDFECMPIARGQYFVRTCYVGQKSPMGFWIRRKTVEINCEVRVYPNLKDERRNLAGQFLYRGMTGSHAVRQVGQGREFEKLREYIPGDSYTEIHWKATAKRNRPVTKTFQVERTQQVYVVIDSSRLSARIPFGQVAQPFLAVQSGRDGDDGIAAPPGKIAKAQPGKAVLPPPPVTMLERSITAALVLAGAAQRQGDQVGVVTYSDSVENFIRASSGRAHYRLVRDCIYALEPKMVTPDFSELVSSLRLRLRRRALLVFLTSMDDPIISENFADNISILSRQHLVLVNMIRPPGIGPLFDEPVAVADEVYHRLAGHMQWRRLRELQKQLKHRGISFNLAANERFCLDLVSQYVSIKRRQLL